MIRFYGAHQSLQLFSMPLQETLKNQTFNETCDLKPLWISYHSATTMLRLMAEFSSFLSLCQDSIHVMTAYSAVLLIKVRHSILHCVLKPSHSYYSSFSLLLL
jgi:hypothetical protein